ncbi:MAG: TRZ/ATZ family hydrolase [Porticoccaceae bacterium]
MAKQSAELLLSARWILPMIPENAVYMDCAVVIDSGRIIALLPRHEAADRFAPRQRFDLGDSVLMPGLINAHGHAAMSLLRGYADDLPLHTWLNHKIWPAEERWVGADFVRDGSELAIAEMLLGGTTCFADMYFFPDQVAAAAQAAGMRCQLAFPVFEFPTAWARTADEYIHKGLALRDASRDCDLLSVAFGPHAPYTVSDQTFEKIVVLAGEIDCPIHLHLHETAEEVATALTQTGVRPIARLRALGVLSPTTQCVHMTQVSGSDISLLVETGAHVIHCPQSNLKLASGFCPVKQLHDAGINVALGTDGAASNNSLDLFDEMKTAALLAKAVSGDPTALSVHDALRMATINGARALGLEATIGSIEVGKAADLIAVNFAEIPSQPLYNLASQLVYAGSGRRVSHAWIRGRAVVSNYQLQTLSEPRLLASAQTWRQRIAGSPPS